MSTVMKISPQGQIRIPKKVMQTLNIEKGDYVEVEIDQNQIILKPRKLIDRSYTGLVLDEGVAKNGS